jgi:hypothetical protein
MVDPAPDPTADSRAPAPAPTPNSLGRALSSWLPWLSLASGIASAVTMDRGPRRAALVAVAAVLLWLTLLSRHWLARLDRRAGPHRSWWMRVMVRSSLAMTQSAVQLALFFALPFYWHAASLELPHLCFMLGLATLCAMSLWDPLTERLLMRPLLAPLLPAIASFVALNAVLPGLGLSTHQSLRVAALTAATGVAVTTAATAPAALRRRATGLALLAGLLLPAALELGAARIVPAAPLRLVKIEIGTRLEGKWVADSVERLEEAPERLFCASAIGSPIGVKDRLFHVWRYDGALRSRIELTVRGGREAGYRTYSRIDHFGSRPSGVYSCSVETASGQVLGSRRVRIVSPRG